MAGSNLDTRIWSHALYFWGLCLPTDLDNEPYRKQNSISDRFSFTEYKRSSSGGDTKLSPRPSSRTECTHILLFVKTATTRGNDSKLTVNAKRGRMRKWLKFQSNRTCMGLSCTNAFKSVYGRPFAINIQPVFVSKHASSIRARSIVLHGGGEEVNGAHSMTSRQDVRQLIRVTVTSSRTLAQRRSMATGASLSTPAVLRRLLRHGLQVKVFPDTDASDHNGLANTDSVGLTGNKSPSQLSPSTNDGKWWTCASLYVTEVLVQNDTGRTPSVMIFQRYWLSYPLWVSWTVIEKTVGPPASSTHSWSCISPGLCRCDCKNLLPCTTYSSSFMPCLDMSATEYGWPIFYLFIRVIGSETALLLLQEI